MRETELSPRPRRGACSGRSAGALTRWADASAPAWQSSRQRHAGGDERTASRATADLRRCWRPLAQGKPAPCPALARSASLAWGQAATCLRVGPMRLLTARAWPLGPGSGGRRRFRAHRNRCCLAPVAEVGSQRSGCGFDRKAPDLVGWTTARAWWRRGRKAATDDEHDWSDSAGCGAEVRGSDGVVGRRSFVLLR